MRKYLPVLLGAALLFSGGVELLTALPQLPEPVATHFGRGGLANGWMSKRGLVLFDVGLFTGVSLLILGLGRLFRRLPAELFNLPNRDYWFAPERREASLEMLQRHLTWLLVWVAGLLVATNHAIIVANRETPPRLDEGGFVWLLVGAVVALLGWAAGLLLIFGRPK